MIKFSISNFKHPGSFPALLYIFTTTPLLIHLDLWNFLFYNITYLSVYILLDFRLTLALVTVHTMTYLLI